MKTLCETIPVCLAIQALAPAASAQTQPASDLRTFAVCAGRLSALMEHQWLVDGPASEATARSREAMLALVDAVAPQGQGAQVMGWRIEAKVAQAGLLTRATFGRDRLAKQRADYLIGQCLALIGQS
ncbi:hypothetical protein [Tabrizicola sp. BL-A-41-H6]|uniref:hypothetical protein n=1 Tax=Tabrizicola sp. BL-A-41-H6 TaxID=3421107 RepID=UPI003D6676DB